MKHLPLFLLLLIPGCYVWGQTAFLPLAQLENQIRKFPIADNQYFSCLLPKHILLFTILDENQLLNKDSIFSDSRLLHQNILKYAGSNLAAYYIQIVYIGKLSDRNSVSFAYQNNHYIGSTPYWNAASDTLVANLDNWRWLGDNKYVRMDSSTIRFHYIVSDIDVGALKATSDIRAIELLTDYVSYQFRMFETIEITYHDRWGFDRGLAYEVQLDNLMLAHLQQYVQDKKKAKKMNSR